MGGGGGGLGPVLQFKWQEWSNGGKSQNPKKSLDQNLIPQKSHFEFLSHNNFQRNYATMIRPNYHKSADCFEYPKKSLLKSSYSKKYMPKFSYPNKIPKSKISNPTKSFDHPCHLKSGEPPPPPSPKALINTSYWPLWSRYLSLPGGHFFLVTGGLTL